MPKVILHILQSAQPEGTGIAHVVAALASRLDPSKYKLHAWFLGAPGPLVDELRDAGATTKVINWWRGARDPLGGFRFFRQLRGSHFDLIHLHQHFGSRSVCGLISYSTDARLIVHLHGLLSAETSAGQIPVGMRNADAVIAVSQAAASRFPSLRPTVVYSGVEASSIDPSFQNKQATDVVIGAASRLVPLKGLLLLLEAVANLRTESAHLRLEIAGDGPQREELERAANQLGIEKHVKFLGWQPKIRSVLQGWDIFAMPSLDEGLPISVLEAMAEGLPVIASSAGGLSEIVVHEQTGFLFPLSDVPALTASLRTLIQDSAMRRQMGAAGRDRVQKDFSTARMVAEVATIYDSLLN